MSVRDFSGVLICDYCGAEALHAEAGPPSRGTPWPAGWITVAVLAGRETYEICETCVDGLGLEPLLVELARAKVGAQA